MKYCWCLLLSTLLFGQNLRILNQEKKTVSFRGLSVVNPDIFWVAGSEGVIGKTEDGGNTFQWMIQKKYLKNEFRDIQAFDNEHCIVMAITQPAAILETTNGGKSFKKQFEDKDEKAFFDAFDCTNFDQCILVGDAVQPNQLYVLSKLNGKWEKRNNTYNTRNGEVFFAASGTNVQIFDGLEFIAVSGGSVSRLIYDFHDIAFAQELEIIQGHDTAGANSVYYDAKNNQGIIVGGDFKLPEQSMFNMILFQWNQELQNFEFQLPNKAPLGYKSCVTQLNQNLWVCCGTSGIDYSVDAGLNWLHFSDDAYHVVQKYNEKAAILAGPEGKIALLEF